MQKLQDVQFFGINANKQNRNRDGLNPPLFVIPRTLAQISFTDSQGLSL